MTTQTREQKARYYGDQVGRWQPAGRRLSPGSHERVEWQKSHLREVLAREGLSDLYALAEDALIDRVTKQSHKMHHENYRRAYGSTSTRKPSSRRLAGESDAEYAGRLRSLGRFTEDEIYEKAYRFRRDPSKYVRQGKIDRRYTFEREFTGHPSGKPQYVARFEGTWIGSSPRKEGAIKLAEKYEAARWSRDPRRLSSDALSPNGFNQYSHSSVARYHSRKKTSHDPTKAGQDPKVFVVAVAYKRPREGQLRWIEASAPSPKEAYASIRNSSAHKRMLSEGYLEYGVQGLEARDPGQAHGVGKLRVERGPTGNALWHLPKPSPFVIYWNGPGSRLLFGTNKPGSMLSPIDHYTANGNYTTFKQASAAVKAFWTSKS